MIENDETLKNMINHSVMEKPLDFQNTFNAAITDRINSSINNKKIEIAQSLFRPEEPEEYSEEEISDESSQEEAQEDTEEEQQNGEES
jgi:hypothetical protein